MVQLIDFDKLDVIKLAEDEVKIVDITIEREGLLDLSPTKLYDELFAVVHEKIAAAAILPTQNIYFNVNIKDSTADDIDSLGLLCANIIAANLLVGKNREREMRLKVPPILNTNGLFGFVWLRNMVNGAMLCDRIGGVVRINDDEMRLV